MSVPDPTNATEPILSATHTNAPAEGQSDLPPRIGRIDLIDTLRGVALIAMATYHFSWDLEFFGYLDPGTATTGLLKYYARGIAGSFLFLAGLSLVLGQYPVIRWKPFGRRLAMIAGAAAAITIATYFATPDAFIFFGILHSIALGSLLGLAFLRAPPLLTLVVGIAVLVLPQVFRSALFETPALSFLGLQPTPPRSNDFVPLFPWFGMVLIGIAVARIGLKTDLFERLRRLPQGPRWLMFAGRHSLAVYLIHQPVLIGIAYLMSLVVPPAQPDPAEAYLRNCEVTCTAQEQDAGICVAFCACTLDRLQQQSLFEPLQQGQIAADQDQRIARLANECTAESELGNP